MSLPHDPPPENDLSTIREGMKELAVDVETLASKKYRTDILRLKKRLERVKQVQDLLQSTKNYIGREDRELLIFVLQLHQRRSKSHGFTEQIDTLIDILRASTKNRVDSDSRRVILDVINSVLGDCASDLDNISPRNDDERFQMLLDNNKVLSEHQIHLRAMKVFMWEIHSSAKRMKLDGENDKEKFFADICSRYGFENPDKYFLYNGNASVPIGQMEAF